MYIEVQIKLQYKIYKTYHIQSQKKNVKFFFTGINENKRNNRLVNQKIFVNKPPISAFVTI